MKNIIIASALLLALSACNTTRGFGEDLQAAGSWMSSTAEKTQNPSTSRNTASARIRPVEDSYSYPTEQRTIRPTIKTHTVESRAIEDSYTYPGDINDF